MVEKLTYEELAQRVRELEQEKLESNMMKKAIIHGEELPTHKIESGMNAEIHIPELELDAIINAEEIQSIMDEFCHLTNMVTAILDLNGKVIEATGWQDICVKFHRINPKTALNCTESDLFLAKNLKPGEYASYKCKNGLWDVVTPLYIENKHLGNIYTGQFFYDDDHIDEEFFIKQAEACGFDKDSYIDAFRRIPRYSRETISHLMHFLVKFTTYISKVGFSNIQLEKEIRERKLVEEMLHHKTALLEAQLNSSIDGVIVVDTQRKKILQNQRTVELWKIPQHIADNNDDETQVQYVMHMTKNPEQFVEKVAYLYKHPNESSRDEVELTDGTVLDRYSAPVLGEDGQNFGRIWTFRDITERKQAEDALRESEEQLSNAMEIARLGHWEYDVANDIFTFNDQFYSIFRTTAKQVGGYTMSSAEYARRFVHPDDMSVVAEETRKAVEATDPHFNRLLEHRILYGDGTVGYIVVRFFIVKDSQNRTVKTYGVNQDITERKRLMEEREKLETQLQQAQKMEAIGTLAGGVAHDFNNILTTILGNADIAEMKDGKNGHLEEELGEIRKAGERASALTRQLLAFSRKQIIQPEIVDLNTLLTNIEKMLGRLIREDVELLTIPGPGLWQVEMDPGQIEQIIMNLVVNARDAMPMGGKLTIETVNEDLDGNCFREHGIKEQPGAYVMLAVSDTGSGMDKETQEHIFEPFFTTKEQGKGSGLGLSMVYGIVKQNKGFIWVYSEPGQGSTFKVYLPKAKGDVVSEKKEHHPVTGLGGSETVLIVEDDDSLRKLAHKALQQKGYKVLAAENGEDALRVSEAHNGSIDLLITDVVMPKMSGKETAERLQPLYPQMKVIYMSGYTDDAIVHHGVLAPELNFLEKPFSPDALARKVREVLDE